MPRLHQNNNWLKEPIASSLGRFFIDNEKGQIDAAPIDRMMSVIEKQFRI